jgi:F420-dependent oxidoreductase-like protein
LTIDMSIGVSLSMSETTNYVDGVVDQAREAAGAGLRSAWFGQRFDYDSAALAGIVGREVPELQVGSSAIPIFARHPILVSSQAQTTQAATHGRYHLGLALGAKSLVEQAFGIPHDRPIARLREFLIALRSLLETGSVDFHGELLTAASPMPAAVPGAEPPVPVLVAAMGPQALRVTGEFADGTLPYLAGPKTLGSHIVPAITAAAEKAGRPAPRIVAFVAGVVTADIDSARATALQRMAFYDRVPSYQRIIALEGASRAADLAVIGDEETVAAAVRRYFEAGVTEIVFTQTDLAGDTGRQRTWRLLGELNRGS